MMNNMPKKDRDVISLPVEIDEKIVDSRYRLVMAVIKRAKELLYGDMPKISTRSVKVTTKALEEVISGYVHVLSGEAAVKAQEESGKLTYENMMDEAEQKTSFYESKTELEKDVENYLLKKGQKERID